MDYFLSNASDQSFWINVGSSVYSVRLYEFRGLLYADISKSQTKLISGMRVLPNKWMLPYRSIGNDGNFRLETRRADKNEYPNSEGLNTTFVLAIYTDEEIAKLENA